MGKRGFRDHRESDQNMGRLEGLGEEPQGYTGRAHMACSHPCARPSVGEPTHKWFSPCTQCPCRRPPPLYPSSTRPREWRHVSTRQWRWGQAWP